MNVLQVYHSWDIPEAGGVISMVRDLIHVLEKKNTVHLLIADWSAASVTECQDDARTYHRLRLVGPPSSLLSARELLGFLLFFPVSVIRLISYCRARKIDVAHLHYLNPYQLVFTVARLFGGPPYILTMHGSDVHGYPKLSWLQRDAVRLVLAKSARLVAVSDALAAMAQDLIDDSLELTTIHNGCSVDVSKLPSRKELEHIIQRSLPGRFAIIVANIRALKGHDVALRAWVEVSEKHPDTPLILVGGGPDLKAVEALSKALGLGMNKV